MRWKSLTKEQRERLVLKALLGLIAIAAAFVYGLKPMLERMEAERAELQGLQGDLDSISRLLGRQQALRTGLEENVRTLRTLFTQKLPPLDNPFLWATERVYRYAREHHVAVESITEARLPVPLWVAAPAPEAAKPAEEEAEDARRRPPAARPATPSTAPKENRKEEAAAPARRFAPYSVQVRLRCAYPDLLAFIAAIERDNPYASISSLSILSDESWPEQQSIRLSIEWPRHVGPLDKAIRDAVLAGEESP